MRLSFEERQDKGWLHNGQNQLVARGVTNNAPLTDILKYTHYEGVTGHRGKIKNFIIRKNKVNVKL